MNKASGLYKQLEEAYLIDDSGKSSRSKDDYIMKAKEGEIVAFRLNFKSRQNVNLTKVISGKILVNESAKELLTVETRNGLQYGVPYSTIVWVKTGERWPRGVYEEMKEGSVEVNRIKVEDDVGMAEFNELDELDEFDEVEGK